MRVKGPFLVEIDRLKAVNQQLEIELADLKAITELAEKRGDTLEHLVKSEAHHKWIAEDKVEALKLEIDRYRAALDKIFHESPFPSSAINIARKALQIERLQNEKP